MMNYELRIAGIHYEELKSHLFPGDGKEAVAIALCGTLQFQNRTILLVNQLCLIPHEDCSIREETLVEWPSRVLESLLPIAERKKMSILKIHSHPTAYANFSKTDNLSDKNLFSSVFGWIDEVAIHCSAVMLPNGKLFARIIHPDLSFKAVNKINIAGHDIVVWTDSTSDYNKKEQVLRIMQTFGEGTTSILRQLKVGVVGCSGTGSPTIEQLARLGIGELVLVDPDRIEKKNLNRILNSTLEDALEGRLKVNVIANAISSFGFGTKVHAFQQDIYASQEVIFALASCDLIFGCVDSIDGRHLLNQISTFYLIPYFDLGVKIIADGMGGIEQICGNIHYIQPGGSSLKGRGVYTSEELRSAGLKRTNPTVYAEEKKSGYIVNVPVGSPAVISLNMYASSIAMNELLARIHPFRNEENKYSSIIRFSLSDNFIQREEDIPPDLYLSKFVGRGTMLPLLNMPEISINE